MNAKGEMRYRYVVCVCVGGFCFFVFFLFLKAVWRVIKEGEGDKMQKLKKKNKDVEKLKYLRRWKQEAWRP